MRSLSTHLAKLAAAYLFAASAPNAFADKGQTEFSIPEQPLSRALIAFAVQSRVSIQTPPENITQQTSASVSGLKSPDMALKSLLAGTSFTYERVDAVTYRIVAKPAGPDEAATNHPPPTIKVQSPPISDRLAIQAPIIVTSTRRPRLIGSVPNAITFLDPDTVSSSLSRDTHDFSHDASGVIITNVGSGRNKIIIRGVSDGIYTGQAQSTVGLYLDETRLTYAAPDPDLHLTDIDQIEILRGPQGTRYGSGSIGGIYSITSKRPNIAEKGGFMLADLAVTEDGERSHSLEGMLNIPLIENRLGMRAVAYTVRDGGWLNNPVLQLSDTNTTVKRGGRLTARGKLGDTWIMDGQLVLQTIASDDAQYVSDSDPSSSRPTQILEPHENDFKLANLTSRGATRLGELTVSTSIMSHEVETEIDATGVFEGLGFPASAVTAFEEKDLIQLYSHEMRLAGVSSRVPWGIGLFLSQQRRRTTEIIFDPVTDLLAYRLNRHDKITESALFGNVTIPLLPTVDTSLGFRLFGSDTEMRATRVEPLNLRADARENDRNDNGLATNIELSWRPADEILIYGSATEGYRIGGFNTVGFVGTSSHDKYDGDELWNYELGSKLTLLSGRLDMRAALFYQSWTNVLTDQSIDSGFVYSDNIGNAKNLGIEAEFLYRSDHDMELRGHVTYSDADIVEPSTTFGLSPDTSLPGAPDLIAGLSGSKRWKLRPDIDMTGVARLFYVGPASSTYNQTLKDNIGNYVLADLSLGVSTDNWALQFYVNNLLNERAPTFSYNDAIRSDTSDYVTLLKPRRVGLILSRSF